MNPEIIHLVSLWSAILLIVIGIAFLLGMAKKLFISSVVSISMPTSAADGEQLTFSVNFSVLDTQKSKYRKMSKLFELAEERRSFVQRRFEKVIEEAKAEKSRLKGVK
jgi:hypothetical protein